MNLKDSLKNLVLISLLGSLWGGLEATLGTLLHAASIPFTGMIMASMGMFIVTFGCVLVPRPGVATSIGFIAAFLKLFSIAALKINPALGIMMEAFIAEVLFYSLGRGKMAIYLVFILANLCTVFQNYISLVILYGYNFKYFLSGFQNLLSHFNVAIYSLTALFFIYIGIKVLIGILMGALAGKISFDLIHRIKLSDRMRVTSN